jgi:hypothetical protein
MVRDDLIASYRRQLERYQSLFQQNPNKTLETLIFAHEEKLRKLRVSVY